MRIFYLLPALLLLTSCEGTGGPGKIDPQKFLSTAPGPKVPTMQDTLLESAKAAETRGDFNQAANLYRQALEKRPDDKDIALSLADSYRRSGSNDQALMFYDRLLAKDSANLAAKEGKGLALMAKGDFESPVPLFQEVVKADQTRWKTLNALGILFTTRNMHPEAQQYFEAALKNNPKNASITNNMGLAQALDRQYDTAQTTLAQASSFAPSGSQQRQRIDLNMALVYAIAGKLDQAKAIAEQYYSGAALNNNLGLYAHLSKDDQMAKAYLNMALTESKTFYEKAWNNLEGITNNSTTTSGGTSLQMDAPAAGKSKP